jgi:hypothetical protein
MKLTSLYEMGAKAVCPKCGQGPMSKTHYWYKGGWQCKSPSVAAAPTPSVPSRPLATPTPAAPPVAVPTPTAARTPVRPAGASAQGNALPRAAVQGMPPSTQLKMLEQYLKKIDVKNFTIAPDMSVSVNGSVDVKMQPHKKVPCKFTKVTGNFTWTGGEITTMENFPDEVGGNLDASNNNITSLVGLPKVGEDIHLQQNQIASYQGLPTEVNGDLDIYANPAADIVEHLPSKINGSLSIGSSSKLSIRGIHKKTHVDGDVTVVGELEEGGLGLMLVKGIKHIESFNRNDKSPTNPRPAFEIMNAALEAKEDVLDVQEKLIDAGFSRYAKL